MTNAESSQTPKAVEPSGHTNGSGQRKDREAEAAAIKAEAEAAKAKADAAKAKADAAKADADARKAEQEVAEYDSAAATHEREAAARKKTAEAEKDATAARRAQFAALIPDLSSVKDSTLEVKEGPALWSSFLLGRAVNSAGQAVADKLKAPDTQTRRVLVTSDPDLATADAVYADVQTGLAQLITAATQVLDKTTAETVDEAVQTAGVTPVDTALEAAGAIAGAVPAVLSLFSAHRTLGSAAVTASDLAAAAAVAGAMTAHAATTVAHDDFRLVPGSGVYALTGTVGEKRQDLVAQKIALGDKKSAVIAELATAKAELEAAQETIPAPSGQPQQIEAAKRKIADVEARLSVIELRVGVIDSLLTAADAFIATVRTIPAGARRSPLATAALHEQLHTGDYTHVLLVKTQAGQAQQLLDNQPLWLRDKFSTAVEISVTFMLIETPASVVVAAGTESVVQSAHGKIGDRPTLDAPL